MKATGMIWSSVIAIRPSAMVVTRADGARNQQQGADLRARPLHIGGLHGGHAEAG